MLSQRPAVVIGDTLMTYHRFQQDIAHAARRFQQQLSNPGGRVGIAVTNDYWHWVATLATLRLGLACASVPLDRVPAMAQRFDVWIGEVTMPDRQCLQFSPPTLASLDEQAGLSVEPADPEASLFLLGAGARRLILTSGTTGQPKAVSLTAQQLKDRAHAVIKNLQLQARTRLLSLMGLDTIGGLTVPLATWLSGGCVLLGVSLPGAVNRYSIPYQHCNVLLASPARLKQVLEQSRGAWPGQAERRILVGGSRLHKAVRDEALSRACHQVTMMYGSTETSSVAYGDATLLDRHPGAAGFVLGMGQVQIVDTHDQPVPNGSPGTVRCRTSFMAQRYEEGQNEEVFRGGWFYPGDQGVIYDDGFLAITGRLTDVLNVGGAKFSALELETQLQDLDEVKDICAVVVQDREGDRLALAVVCDDGLDLDMLRRRVVDRMPQSLPFHLIRVASLPRNGMGKLPRSAIARHLQGWVTTSRVPHSA